MGPNLVRWGHEFTLAHNVQQGGRFGRVGGGGGSAKLCITIRGFIIDMPHVFLHPVKFLAFGGEGSADRVNPMTRAHWLFPPYGGGCSPFAIKTQMFSFISEM